MKKDRRTSLKKYNWVLRWGMISLIFALAIHVAFKITAPIKFLEAVWSAGDILTYTSTIALGLLAFWQNQRLYQESYKQEIKNLTIENYVLFIFEDLEVLFYDKDDNPDNGREVEPFEMGYNGDKAFWKYDSIKKDKLNIKLKIKNIGDHPAVNIIICDEHGKKVKGSNILHSEDKRNDKKYILNEECGIMVINIDLYELFYKKILTFYLNSNNPFGLDYSQKIKVKSNYPKNKIIQIDAQCTLCNILPFEK